MWVVAGRGIGGRPELPARSLSYPGTGASKPRPQLSRAPPAVHTLSVAALRSCSRNQQAENPDVTYTWSCLENVP